MLLWASLCINFSTNAQDISVTGNLVNNNTTATDTTSTWQNVGLWNQGLPCWGPGGPVYCGPQPYFNNGSFNFSYGTTYVNQTVDIANALANSGSGLRVNGYNFGFTAKNGNGWDNGMTDYLYAYVQFKDQNSVEVYSKTYNLNYQFNWTTFNYNETFTTPYALKDLSTATYGFIGRDNNYWAGPYGPEVYNINFSLKYSVDPCVDNAMYSPTCPGYLDALAKLTPATTTTTTSTVTPTTTTTTVAPTVTETPTTNTTSVVSAPVAVTPTTTSSTPSATNPQPKAGEVQVSGSKPTVSTSQILSIVSAEQNRIGKLESATAQQAVSEANKIAEQTTQQAEAVAATLTSSSISSSMTQSFTPGVRAAAQQSSSSLALQGNVPTQLVTVNVLKTGILPTEQEQKNTNEGSVFQINILRENIPEVAKQPVMQQETVAMLAPPKQMQQVTQENNVPATQTFEMKQPEQKPVQTTFIQQINYVSPISYSLVEPSIFKYEPKKFESSNTDNDPPKMETFKMGTRNTLSDYMNDNVFRNMTMMETTQQDTGVKRNVAPNELAGSVDVAAMATIPRGYDAYTNLAMKDVSFYKPEEIYKNQNNVDNVRALRQLSSDRVHQEMVNQQYRGR